MFTQDLLLLRCLLKDPLKSYIKGRIKHEVVQEKERLHEQQNTHQ